LCCYNDDGDDCDDYDDYDDDDASNGADFDNRVMMTMLT